MRTLILLSLLFAGTPALFGQALNAQDKKLIQDYILSQYISETTVVNPAVTSKVFSGRFYIVSSGFKYQDMTSYCSDFNFNLEAGKIRNYENVSEDHEMPQLVALIKKDYLLKDEPSAKAFEATLNELFPVKKEDLAGVKHYKKGNQWIFIRGKFFEDKSALIVTVAPNGTITKIENKLAYIETR